MRSIFRGSLIVLALFSLCLRADIVTLTDGRTVEGEIIGENATEIVLKTSIGKTTVKREEIQSIEKKKSAAAQIREKIDALDKGKNKDDKEAWLSLADQATRAGARDEAAKAYDRVMAIDPDDASARRALGYVKSGGNWVSKSDLDKKAAADAGAAKPAADAGGGMTKEKKAAAAGVNELGSLDEKPVNCPRCNGTGIWITLPCLNCNKSGKPGYKKLGDHYEEDQRCGGTGKVIGMYCELCNKTGKVMMSHIAPADGGTKPPPAGRAWCPVCHGTGVEEYLPCNQCKRSQWPGYCFFGDRVMKCVSCNGAGKVVALICRTCNHTGLVNAAPPSDPNIQFGIGVGPKKQ